MSGSGAPHTEGHSSVFQTIFPGKHQRISFTASAQASNAFQASTNVVEIFATQNCWVRFGEDPTAAASDGDSIPIPGGLKLTYGVSGGQKISVIRDTTNGTIDIIEGANQ